MDDVVTGLIFSKEPYDKIGNLLKKDLKNSLVL